MKVENCTVVIGMASTSLVTQSRRQLRGQAFRFSPLGHVVSNVITLITVTSLCFFIVGNTALAGFFTTAAGAGTYLGAPPSSSGIGGTSTASYSDVNSARSLSSSAYASSGLLGGNKVMALGASSRSIISGPSNNLNENYQVASVAWANYADVIYAPRYAYGDKLRVAFEISGGITYGDGNALYGSANAGIANFAWGNSPDAGDLTGATGFPFYNDGGIRNTSIGANNMGALSSYGNFRDGQLFSYGPNSQGFRGFIVADALYNQSYGGYTFNLLARVQSLAYNSSVEFDLGRSVHVSAILDSNGNAIPFSDLEFASGANFNVVPEPASIAIWGIGALGMGLVVRRKKKLAA